MDTELEKEDEALKAVIECVKSRWTLGRTHGIGHWNRVWENGQKLLTPDVDPVVVHYFAYLHDSCREDDYEDLEHGARAAEWIGTIRESLLSHLSDEQIDKLQTACRLHTIMQGTGDPTVDACFDSDRLDLWRVGIKPNPYKMATLTGAKLARQITDEKMRELRRSLYRG